MSNNEAVDQEVKDYEDVFYGSNNTPGDEEREAAAALEKEAVVQTTFGENQINEGTFGSNQMNSLSVHGNREGTIANTMKAIIDLVSRKFTLGCNHFVDYWIRWCIYDLGP